MNYDIDPKEEYMDEENDMDNKPIANENPQVYIDATVLKTMLFKEKKMSDIDYIAMIIKTVVRDDMITDGYASYDVTQNIFTCTVPPWVKIVNVDKNSVGQHHLAGISQFHDIHQYPSIFSIQIDDSQKPCCIWYSPTAKEINKMGSEQVAHYPYDKPLINPGCFNPDLTGSKNVFDVCGYVNPMMSGFSQCKHHTMSSWEDVTVAYEGDNKKFAIQRKLLGARVPHYAVYDYDNNVIISEGTSIPEIKESFESVIQDKGYSIVSVSGNKNSYFKAIFA